MTIAFAQRIYPTVFGFDVNKQELEGNKTDKYVTHRNEHAARLHWVVEKILLMPFRLCLWSYAHCFDIPCPGEGKNKPLWQQRAIRVMAFVLFLISLPLAIASLLISMPLRAVEHGYRPLFQYLRSDFAPDKVLTMKKGAELHVRTANLSLTPSSWVNVSNDMRSPNERAVELAHSILEDPEAPDVIVVQESWNEAAAKIFMTMIAEKYGHIIHSICPQIGGMDSGYMVLSKAPIEKVRFERFTSMTWQHSMPPRGILAVHINTEQGPVILYNLHTQSMFGPARAQARIRQLEQLDAMVKRDQQTYPNAHPIMMGDLNTSAVNEWGEIDRDEIPVTNRMKELFEDPYFRDHEANGKRKPNTHPHFHPKDIARMQLSELLPEPTSSFYYGPIDNEVPRGDNHFATDDWYEEQPMHTGCRLDYILIPKNSPLDVTEEIRRIAYGKKNQIEIPSPPSDHGFLDARIFLPQVLADDRKGRE